MSNSHTQPTPPTLQYCSICDSPGAFYTKGRDWANNDLMIAYTNRVFTMKNETYWLWADNRYTSHWFAKGDETYGQTSIRLVYCN